MISNMSRRFSAEVASGEQLPVGEVRFMQDKATQPPARGRGFVARETRRSLSNMQGGDYLLLPGAFKDVGRDGTTAHVNLHPQQGYTREASRNQVRFGQLVVNDPDSRERVELVAIKPLDTPGRAAREFGAMSVVNGLAAQGRMSPALTPLGFFRNPEDGRVALMTRYEHSVLTLDNLFWDPNFTPTERISRAALGHCAISLGELHSNGIAHTDAQIKNIAADNNGIRYVDLEGVQELAMASGHVDAFAAKRLIEIDVRDCLESLNGHAADYIEESFVPIYRDIVTQPSSLVPAESVLDPQEIYRMV
jgi:hypothetical protein